MIDLLIEIYDFIENDKFANQNWKSVISGKLKVFPLVCSKYLSSWIGLGKSGHVRFPTFGLISHVSGPKMVF